MAAGPRPDTSCLFGSPRVAHRIKHFAPECVLERFVVFVAFDLEFVFFRVVNLQDVGQEKRSRQEARVRGRGRVRVTFFALTHAKVGHGTLCRAARD